MNTQKDERRANQPRSRVKRRKGNILPYVIIISALAGAALYFYFQKNPSSTYLDYGTAVGTNQIQTIPDAATTDSTDQTDSTEKATKTTSHPDIPKIDPTGTVGIIPDTDLNPAHQQQDNQQHDNQQQDNQQQIDENPGKYLAAIDTLNSFYTHLDQQAYIKDFQLTEPSREHFTKLIGKLLENPPIVARETDDLFTLLKNTAHFFRILGKDNIILLKGILDREKDSLEDMLKAFYTLTEKPQYLEQEYGLMVNPEALYDYASFLIHTMGGRLYLFRRDSTSRMAVSYYAIEVIDRANDEGNSRHGIDLRPAVAALTEEIEIGGSGLNYRDDYLLQLYNLEEKYQ